MRRRAFLLGVMSVAAAARARAMQPKGDVAWAPGDPAYRLQLPRDHGSHPRHKIEWWYYTGNLLDAAKRRFGYQLTFFRVGIDPRPANPSRWAVRDLFMAHFAVTDVGGQRYRASDRLSRAGVGWAGAAEGTLDVWNDDWSVKRDADGRHVLRAAGSDMSLALSLDEGKPFVAHGEGGYSQKGQTAGNASHYYSLTRMPTRGTLQVGGQPHEVSGESWMDHEFGSSFLEPGQRGWDWFSIQFDDGTELMLYRIRADETGEGGPGTRATGTFVDRDGRARMLSATDLRFVPGRRWASSTSGARYPVEWQLDVVPLKFSLRTRAVLDGQELHTEASTNVTYWEGAIDVEGTREGRPIRGRGYLELTGYTGAPLSDVLR